MAIMSPEEKAYLKQALDMPLDFKVEKAVALLKGFRDVTACSPECKPVLCFSGGKDSVCIRALADMAGIEYDAAYNVTSIDPPELVRFIKTHHPDVRFVHRIDPRDGRIDSFFRHMVNYGVFPTRLNRWCCEVFKHNVAHSEVKIVGVRAAESAARANRWKPITRWQNGKETVLAPLLYFTDNDVWEFIRSRNLPYCELYDEGFRRLGCVGCPMAGYESKLNEFRRWPKYEALYRRAFAGIWAKRQGTISRTTRKEWFGSRKFHNPDELFEWWLSGKAAPEDLREITEEDGAECPVDADGEVCTMGMH